ncbi:decaprenyl-phosphate phosphoribosyltransferase [Ramlibacter sp. PS4R-6]|uniref:decaprenyl-phosphate phosphoribosyltransferase n=1 Tax=Ramlibacter sp. PS4R-6 TaxID=3133438 RepID=UPI0030B122D0
MEDNAALNVRTGQMPGLVRLMRPKQWVKNGFVLAPLVFAGLFTDSSAIVRSILAMLLFCAASSAAYIVNDLHDVERDRAHPKKSRSRPLAAGIVTPQAALTLLGVLYAILVAAWFVMPAVVNVIAAYLVLNLAYTVSLKHQPVIDIFVVAIGFVLRVFAGGMALGVPVSSWMFITTLCLALYLAAVKRRQELKMGAATREVLDSYPVTLVERYAEIAATGALVFYGMFVVATRPQLAMTIPLVLFGLFRYWYVVEVHDEGESPTDALLGDWQLALTVVAWVAVCAWSMWPGA